MSIGEGRGEMGKVLDCLKKFTHELGNEQI